MKQLKVNTCLAVVVVASLLSACAQKRVMTLAAAPSDLFDPAAPIEVTGSQIVAKRHGDVIAGAGEGAGKGMLAGAGGSILGGASTGNPAGLALGIFLAPVFAVGGGIYGAAAAHPAEETNAAVAAIERVYADDKLLGALTRDVENQVHSLGFPAPQPCSGQQEGASTVTPTTGDCSPGPSNRLRLTVTYAFATRGSYSPDLGFGIDVQATAANADRARGGSAFRWVYLAPELDFFAATKNDAQGLRSAIAVAQQRLAEKVVDDLLTARREERVSGTYSPNSDGINFRPDAMTPGVAVRVPTKSQLISVPESRLSETVAVTSASSTASRSNESGGRVGATEANERRSGQGTPPFYCNSRPNPNVTDECRNETDGRRAAPEANEAASGQGKIPFFCNSVPLPNSIDECRAAIDAH